MNIKQELREKIISWIEGETPIKMYWDYRDREFDKKQLAEIIENGLDMYIDDLYEMNLDNFYGLEIEFAKNLISNFEDELQEDEEFDEMGDDEAAREIREMFMDYIYVDMNHEELLRNINVVILLKLHSNYDCTNSTDSFGDDYEEENYTNDILHRVKAGVTLEDFADEKANDYTASNFCFVTRMDLLEYLKFKKEFEEHQKDGKLFVPKGTQYGFFSSFNGSGSQFEHSTIADLQLPIVITNYDFIQCVADVEQGYSMAGVYGGTSWVDESNIGILYE